MPKRRPWHKAAMHYIRRGHLYFGLFLLPWVILYGITAFLFNHPGAFSDAPAATFSSADLTGTPMASIPSSRELAAIVVAALQKRAPEGTTYTLLEPEKAKYNREFAFANVKVEGQELNILMDMTGAGGTIRSRPTAAPKQTPERAPFAVGNRPNGGPGGGRGGRQGNGGPGGRGGAGERGGGSRGERGGGERGGSRSEDALTLDDPLHERVKAAVPVVLEKHGFSAGEITVTSVPDLVFFMSDGQKNWTVNYNALNGSVSGQAADAATESEQLSVRRFLTRLHTTHGYPGETNAKWFWAVIVDAMAFIMVFWGLSGVLMWWQIKAARWLGALILCTSVIAATLAGLGMHELLQTAGGGR